MATDSYQRSAGHDVGLYRAATHLVDQHAVGVAVQIETLPLELVDFWTFSSGVSIHQDVEYGQWGLSLFGPSEAVEYHSYRKERRKDDFLPGDFACGAFIGDDDFVVVRCNQLSEDFGAIVIGDGASTRDEWRNVADSLTSFLEQVLEDGRHRTGGKYWEYGR